MKYQRKPAVVEPFRFDADAEIMAPEWFMKEVDRENIFIDRCVRDGAIHVYGCTVYAKPGKMKAKIGDYIILEPSGEIRICKEKEFRKEYERVQGDGA